MEHKVKGKGPGWQLIVKSWKTQVLDSFSFSSIQWRTKMLGLLFIISDGGRRRVDCTALFILSPRSLSIAPGDRSRYIYSRRVAVADAVWKKSGKRHISIVRRGPARTQGSEEEEGEKRRCSCRGSRKSFTAGHVRPMVYPDSATTRHQPSSDMVKDDKTFFSSAYGACNMRNIFFFFSRWASVNLVSTSSNQTARE